VSQPVTVRTLETIIRLATAHAKLRYSKTVELSDIDVAFAMLNEAIFQEHIDKKTIGRIDEEMDESEESEEVVPAPSRSRGRRDRPVEQPPIVPEPKSVKKAKIDTDDQVALLFAAKPVVANADVEQKRLVFKIINSIKDSQNKCKLQAVWKRYLSMNDRETMRKNTSQPLINNKEELVNIVESLERDNAVMFASEDDEIILM
jgi:DNA replicative helicase MCM subunit Mcm2 (Cdc46/Mcm family)